MPESPDQAVAERRYLFEYRHDGAEWGVEIAARSPEEAKRRLQAMTWARFEGEIKASARIPGAGTIHRIVTRCRHLTKRIGL
ncbi:hypothetical protein BOSE62_70399 [Bosea sp. 62]|uniref:hypothetical protein n=1 Tax=unclassified Bosea (in: a-proteobacteria) TaxID=2653178 RepID=UPI00125EDF77|nr:MULTISPECIES: hypothetical protein [unclassified Bosea (in: a-proteobacteria)]CAD5300692.1 hypothetical protein BOSE46_90157 [Bosea sp. 46]VXB46462.1 hypothetical protein BOSE125_130850 [Bosea sp. 125]VXC74944.1 hypothetical protein BOSE62_70399 [Bosea sp. 62]